MASLKKVLILLILLSFLGCSEEDRISDNGSNENNNTDTALETSSDPNGDVFGTDSQDHVDSSMDGSDTDTLIFQDSDMEIDSNGNPDTDTQPDDNTIIDTDTQLAEIPPQDSNNGPRLDRLTCEYRTIEEDANTFTGEIIVGNANKEYVWNGYFFTIWSIDFTTTSEITFAQTNDNIFVDYEQNQADKKVSFDMGWQSLFPLDTIITFTVRGNKSGSYPYPTRCSPKYIRGDVIYPEYQDLPYTWWKGNENVSVADLIHDVDDYYQENVPPIEEAIFVYNPPHNTQIQIGQPEEVNYTVNGYTNLRIWVPSKMMAMGVGFAYQWFKFNPNYFCALGTKENFACGLVPIVDSSVSEHTVNLDGIDYHWYIVFTSPDGPFQQETGNFTDMARFFPDYFPDGVSHDDYTNVSATPEDPHWATAVISSALSSVVTRETLWASPKNDYGRLVMEATDPWAELAIITYTYNRGVYSICGSGVFDDIEAAIQSENVREDYNLTGVHDHVETIAGITNAMNNATDDLYDAELTWSEIEDFFAIIRTVYGRGVPTDEEWDAMLTDVKTAFDVLAEHWGGEHISYRYDFLTLLRVAQKHLPNPTNTRPTTEFWRERVTQFPC